MSYILIFIISLLLNLYPTVENNQPDVKVTFESASLVYDSPDKDKWNYSATVNDLNIKKGSTVEVKINTEDNLVFWVSGQKSAKTDHKQSGNQVTIVDQLKIVDPSVLHIYGSNQVMINANELMDKKPRILQIHTGFKGEKSDTPFPNSTKVKFCFSLDYE